jgi:GNAT superfamily N-acetyltransferase
MSIQASVIRRATAADVEIIVTHRCRMFADMGLGDDAALEAMAGAARTLIEAALRDGSYQGWLAEEGGRVVAGGGVAIVAFQPNPLDPDPRRAWVHNMYTEPACRRRGLATQLLGEIVGWCREQGFKQVFLHASAAGRPLYERAGFAPTSEMRLVLQPGPAE